MFLFVFPSKRIGSRIYIWGTKRDFFTLEFEESIPPFWPDSYLNRFEFWQQETQGKKTDEFWKVFRVTRITLSRIWGQWVKQNHLNLTPEVDFDQWFFRDVFCSSTNETSVLSGVDWFYGDCFLPLGSDRFESPGIHRSQWEEVDNPREVEQLAPEQLDPLCLPVFFNCFCQFVDLNQGTPGDTVFTRSPTRVAWPVVYWPLAGVQPLVVGKVEHERAEGRPDFGGGRSFLRTENP